jgi:hypothetical protein
MKRSLLLVALVLAFQGGRLFADGPTSPNGAATMGSSLGLPRYDHVVIVIEENKDYDQIIGKPVAAYINDTLVKEGASFTKMYGEEHHSQGNYFWLFSGSDQGVGFDDAIPATPIAAPNLGAALISKGLTFKGYSEDLPAIGSPVEFFPDRRRLYARKHVPWVSFSNVPPASNVPFKDFPATTDEFSTLPTVAFVIPNLMHDMHSGRMDQRIPRGDEWLRKNLDSYYQWAKDHNSLLILTFDENDDQTEIVGLTDPAVVPTEDNRSQKDEQNRICTVFAGAHIKPGEYAEGNGITHVNILRTLEAMYGLPKSGAQQSKAVQAHIADDAIVDVFQ